MIPPRRNWKALGHIWRIFHHTERWLLVWKAMAAQDWQEAERRLDDHLQALDIAAPSREALPKMNVAAATIFYRTHQPERLRMAIETAIDQIKAREIRNLAESSYLARYLFELAEYGAGRFPELEDVLLQQAVRAQTLIAPFNLRSIRSDYRAMFPLRQM